jgi:hypothetical protein
MEQDVATIDDDRRRAKVEMHVVYDKANHAVSPDSTPTILDMTRQLCNLNNLSFYVKIITACILSNPYTSLNAPHISCLLSSHYIALSAVSA